MKRKLLIFMGIMSMSLILGACGQESGIHAEELEFVEVPIFECPKEYLSWVTELDFEVSLNIEDVGGNKLSEEMLLNGDWEFVRVFPEQISSENANLLVIFENRDSKIEEDDDSSESEEATEAETPTTKIPPAHNPNGFVAGDINAQFRVTSEILNVRSERNLNSEHVRTLNQGDIVHIRWVLGHNDANPIDTPWGAIAGVTNEFVNMNFLEPVSLAVAPLPSTSQIVVNVDHATNVNQTFSNTHVFNGSVFGNNFRSTDIIIWANGPLRDFQVHHGNSHTIGDIAVGDAVRIQALTDYFAALSFTTISFINENGVREFFQVTDTYGPGADQAGLIPTTGN